MFHRYNEKARRVVYFARFEAGDAGDEHIGPEHLLLGLVRDNEPLWAKIAGPECGSVATQLKGTLFSPAGAKTRLPASADIRASESLKEVFLNAEREADREHSDAIDATHLLMALLRQDGDHPAFEILKQHGITYELARQKTSS
jgi:ATP-dependent Clp protease ATP-binding subunit ClpC